MVATELPTSCVLTYYLADFAAHLLCTYELDAGFRVSVSCLESSLRQQEKNNLSYHFMWRLPIYSRISHPACKPTPHSTAKHQWLAYKRGGKIGNKRLRDQCDIARESTSSQARLQQRTVRFTCCQLAACVRLWLNDRKDHQSVGVVPNYSSWQLLYSCSSLWVVLKNTAAAQSPMHSCRPSDLLMFNNVFGTPSMSIAERYLWCCVLTLDVWLTPKTLVSNFGRKLSAYTY